MRFLCVVLCGAVVGLDIGAGKLGPEGVTGLGIIFAALATIAPDSWRP